MPDGSFWEERPALAAVCQQARARRVSPWAVLGGVLARVVASVDPHVVLPPIVGGFGSINLFIGIVGRSGQGKGASQAAAAALLDLRGGALFETVNVGSGEGLAASFVRRVKDDEGNLVIQQHTESALFDVAEIDTLAALAGRQGSTLLSELRKAWSGERLGFQNRATDRTLPVDAGTYRATLVAGIQPARSGALLDDADGGTPQRFVWFPATDPDAPKRAPEPPEPIVWRAPGEDVLPSLDGRRVMRVCDLAWDTIDSAQLSRLKGDGDALDGHALFSRLKLAAAFALLDMRGEVTDDDWRIAGLAMQVSDATRQACRDAIAQSAQALNRARAEARAEANVVTADHAEVAALARAKDRIIGKLSSEWVGAGPVRSGLSANLRNHFEAAIVDLEVDGAIEIIRDQYQGQERTRLRLAPGRDDNSSTLTATPENPRVSAALRHDDSSVDRAGESSTLPREKGAADA